MEPDILRSLTAGIDDFPALPKVVNRVIRVTGDPESSAHDLMEAISPDPSLTVKVLKIANSAFYSRVRSATSVEDALVVLGFTEIRNIVLSMAVFNTFNKFRKIDQFDIDAFWTHSFMCGLAARVLTAALTLSGNEMFTAGLIHDIGKLAVCMVLPGEFSRVVRKAGPYELRTLPAERQVIGVTHDEIGGRLLKKWLFPKEIVAAVRFHHHLDKAGDRGLFPVVIHLADRLAHINGTGTGPVGGDPGRPDDFSPEIVAMARSHGIEWSPAAVKKYQDELAVQRDAHAEVMGKLLL